MLKPADLGSKGSFPSAFLSESTRFSSFLKDPKLHLRPACSIFVLLADEDRKIVMLSNGFDHILDHILCKLFNFKTARRVLCYGVRFTFNMKHRIEKRIE